MKEEKVVNPPQNPTMSNSLISSEKIGQRLESPNKRPKRKHPVKLTMNVPYGKEPSRPCVRVNWAMR